MTYPMNVGRKFDEILRVIDALQLADQQRVATPADWRLGDKVIIPLSITGDDAIKAFPQGSRGLARPARGNRFLTCSSHANFARSQTYDGRDFTVGRAFMCK